MGFTQRLRTNSKMDRRNALLATQDFDRVVELSEEFDRDGTDPTFLALRARAFLGLGNGDSVVRDLETAEQNAPSNTAVKFTLGLHALSEQEFDRRNASLKVCNIATTTNCRNEKQSWEHYSGVGKE